MSRKKSKKWRDRNDPVGRPFSAVLFQDHDGGDPVRRSKPVSTPDLCPARGVNAGHRRCRRMHVPPSTRGQGRDWITGAMRDNLDAAIKAVAGEIFSAIP
jgi:hypothetical protein